MSCTCNEIECHGGTCECTTCTDCVFLEQECGWSAERCKDVTCETHSPVIKVGCTDCGAEFDTVAESMDHAHLKSTRDAPASAPTGPPLSASPCTWCATPTTRWDWGTPDCGC